MFRSLSERRKRLNPLVGRESLELVSFPPSGVVAVLIPWLAGKVWNIVAAVRACADVLIPWLAGKVWNW